MTPSPSSLARKHCVPCSVGSPALKGGALAELSEELPAGWSVIDQHHLQKDFSFPDFAKALEYTNRVGELAERENHHPDLTLSYGNVRLVIFTHKIEGLTQSDFIFAAKADRLYEE